METIELTDQERRECMPDTAKALWGYLAATGRLGSVPRVSHWDLFERALRSDGFVKPRGVDRMDWFVSIALLDGLPSASKRVKGLDAMRKRASMKILATATPS